MDKSVNLDKIFKDMTDDWFFMDSHGSLIPLVTFYVVANIILVLK